MHEIIKDKIRDQFDRTEKKERDISLAHLAFFLALSSPFVNASPQTEFRLNERSDNFYVMTFERQGNSRELDFLDDFFKGWYDEGGLGLPPYPKVSRNINVSPSDVPSELWAGADLFLQKALGDLYQTLFHPTADQMTERNFVLTTNLTNDTLDDFLGNILASGRKTFDRSLATYGIKYHHPTNWGGEKWRYLVAHSSNQVAGVVGVLEKDQSVSLSYISVAPGFRRQGISRNLYEQLADRCLQNNCLLVRSSPSDMTKDNGITQKYTDILETKGVLYCQYGTYMEHALMRALENGQDYKKLVDLSRIARASGKKDYDQAQDINNFWVKPHKLSPA